MARKNSVFVMGKVHNMSPKLVGKKKTNGAEGKFVLNFQLRCFDEDDKRYYNLPVAIWGNGTEIEQYMEHMQEGDLVMVEGELRYKFIRNPETNELERIYTTVKIKDSSGIEFLSKKIRSTKHITNENLDHYFNEVKLVGNLVHNPVIGEKGFVVAVDRLYPTTMVDKNDVNNDEKTDYITLVVNDKEKIKGNLKKGSLVIVDGKLMTRRKDENNVIPTIVVDVKKIVGR